MDAKTRTWIVILATAIKNRVRILGHFEKFMKYEWAETVRFFFERHTVQYTKEAIGRDNIIAVVHIPSSFRSIAALAWKLLQKKDLTVDGFISNLWAVQLCLDKALMVRQKVWEWYFWNTVVTGGGGGADV